MTETVLATPKRALIIPSGLILLSAGGFEGALEILEPGSHGFGFVASDHASKVGDDVARVVIRDARAPTGSDAFSAVDQHHGNDGDVVFRLHHHVIIPDVVQQRVVLQEGQQNSGGTGIFVK